MARENEIKGFILYPTYEVKDKMAYVHLFGRLENGEPFLTINHMRPYFLIKKSDLKRAEKQASIRFQQEGTELRDFKNNELVKVSVDTPKDVPVLRRDFQDADITCYEADVKYPYRFMIDNDLRGSILIKGEPVKKGLLNVFVEPKLSPADYDVKLKIAAIDIEAKPDLSELYCISIYTDDFRKVLIKSDRKDLRDCITYPDEKSLLEGFKKTILELDPDIITGWNVIDFDLDYLYKLFKKHKIPFVLGRTEEECKVLIDNSFIRESKADFPGRIVLDGMHQMRMSFVKVDDMKLSTVAKSILEEEKLISDENKASDIEKFFINDPQRLADYCLKDSELVMKIMQKLGLFELSIKRSKITGMPLDRINASVASLDSMYLREARKRKLACYSVSVAEKDQPLKGAVVLEPKSGIYDYVIVVDFKSLYPSIIMTFNIDPLTMSKDGEIESPTGARYSLKPEGILPSILEGIMKKREEVRKTDKIASQALKTTMNSMWGAIANPASRFFNQEMANSITGYARYIIRLTAKKLEELGHHIIYGDTDSLFIDSTAKNFDEADAAGRKIQDYVNRFYEQYIEEKYHRKSRLFLEFAKIYKVFMMPKLRGEEKGAKKRYAGLLETKSGNEINEELDFVGLEVVRSDWTELSKLFQTELLDRVFHKKPFEGFIRKFVENLKKGDYDDMLVYKKSMTKNIAEYTKTTPPHVKAAMLLGSLKTNVIKYVMTVNGPEPVEKIRSKIDYQHYIEKQLKPIAESVLTFFGKDFDEIVKQQKSLADY